MADGGTVRIDGKAAAAEVLAELKVAVAELRATAGIVPGLAVVLVGARTDSATYVRNKKKACAEVGIESEAHSVSLPAEVSQEELCAAVRALCANPDVHGVIVQLPLPAHLDEAAVIACVDPAKDVDGLTPANTGLLAQRGRTPKHVPCTPAGVMRLLARAGARLEGAEAVVVGRSNIVGVPMALLLLAANATVTICHSRTRDLASIVRRADVVVAAIGSAEFVRGAWIKPGAVVIDVGMNSVPDATKKAGYRLTGDVEFSEAVKVASAITPVPGGVGPMTIAMLLSNTVNAARAAVAEAAAAAAAAAPASGAGSGK